MKLTIDHVVVWVEDPLRSLEFFENIVGFRGVRVEEFRAGQAPFPSVRISDETILDLMARAIAPMVNAVAAKSDGAVANSAGHPLNHVCISMSEAEFEALKSRLEAHGVTTGQVMENSFGARGTAPRAFYFRDLDGNVFEARYYAD
jgi:catechol 2,3-dioxygenase-like lactoylglutathione lyase family enzyme